MLNRGFLKYTFCLFAFFSFCGLTCFSLSGQEKQSEKQAASPADQPLIVFMIGEEGYKTSESLPAFAKGAFAAFGIPHAVCVR